MRESAWLILIALFFLISTAFQSTACVDHNGTQRVLAEQGYTHIQTTGYGWFSCSKSDSFATRFTAKNQLGKTVNGTVCSGWFKDYTIRFR
jgi:hypothetical protein